MSKASKNARRWASTASKTMKARGVAVLNDKQYQDFLKSWPCLGRYRMPHVDALDTSLIPVGASSYASLEIPHKHSSNIKVTVSIREDDIQGIDMDAPGSNPTYTRLRKQADDILEALRASVERKDTAAVVAVSSDADFVVPPWVPTRKAWLQTPDGRYKLLTDDADLRGTAAFPVGSDSFVCRWPDSAETYKITVALGPVDFLLTHADNGVDASVLDAARQRLLDAWHTAPRVLVTRPGETA